MIPLNLKLTNFLSYRQTAEIDFGHLHLACISGNNGAGKSSLLDAMTWALFNKARKTDDSIIHGSAKSCEVTFDFIYEETTYRIQRQKTRDKTSTVDFFIHDPESGQWRTISEKGVRDTDKVIQQVLRMDYETFINASFFLQGRADQFATQKSSDRKRILSNILGLDIWEEYKEKAIEKRKRFEAEVAVIDTRMAEIYAELAEEENRRKRQSDLEEIDKSVRQERENQEKQLTTFRRMEESAKSQKKTMDMLQNQLDSSRKKQLEQTSRLQVRQEERLGYEALLVQAEDIRRRHQEWRDLREELDRFNRLAAQANDLEKKRSLQESILEKHRGSLEQELFDLQSSRKKISEVERTLPVLKADTSRLDGLIQGIQDEISHKADLESRLKETQHLVIEKRTENNRLHADMNELDSRRKELEHVHDPLCPLCGQNLTPGHLKQLVEDITRDGSAMADQFRENKKTIQELEEEAKVLETKLSRIRQRETDLRNLEKQHTQLQGQVTQSEAILADWAKQGNPRLEQIETELSSEVFAADARQSILMITADLNKLGYDPSRHAQIRQDEANQRDVENQFQKLSSAQAKMETLKREAEDIEQQLKQMDDEIRTLEENASQASISYAEMAAQIPDLLALEKQLQDLMEKESQVNQELGAARQKVDVLAADKKKLASLTIDREQSSRQIMRYKSLERAFGKDGVPAILIEQALPEIENQANDLLDRLSGGSMNIRFLTRREMKTRDEKKETLDILISDPNGVRDYELFSGGEAFRVNFAIRLALSRVLAQRAGARLQTLVIDEGFGSQDTIGRQRLIEAINLVKDDFVLILVITHLEELKDAFPNRIEVEKTPTGSVVSIR